MIPCPRVCNFILGMFFLTIAAPAQQTADYHFEKGNEYYLAEDYERAVQEYEAVLRNELESAELYYNLGNSYYKLGHLGRAILNYERALKLKPKDRNIIFNLRLANLQVKDRIEKPPEFLLFRWNRVLVTALSLRLWAWLLSLLFFLGSLLFALRQLLTQRQVCQLCRQGQRLFFILTLVALLFLVQRFDMSHRQHYGIITRSSVKCLAAPQEGSTELFMVHEGTKVQLLDQDGAWRKIELIDGKQGWLPAITLEMI